MNYSLPCRIECFCSINPSENFEKVKQAIWNIFPNMKIEMTHYSINATVEGVSELDRIKEVIKRRQTQNAYRRRLLKNKFKNSTWFYLNKQAAFVNKIALCDEAEESPLGPIKIVLTSNKIEDVIELLVK